MPLCACIRLDKTCEPSESVRRRNAQTAAAEASDMRISRLEDKMESLLSAMQSFIGARGETAPAVNVIEPINGHGSASSITSHSNSTLVNPTGTNLAFSDGSTFAAGSIATVSPHPNTFLLPHQYPLSPTTPSLIQADERLSFFRSRMLPFFPFIDLTPNMTGWYLRQNRPFLFQAIHTVTIFSTQERLAQLEELKRVLFTSALLEVQSNIDLLLGLLTYITWSTDAFLGRADLLSRLMMLAISLVYDLRLFKPSSTDVEVMMMITQGRADDNNQSPADETPYELLERQRAVLACFILSSKCVCSLIIYQTRQESCARGSALLTLTFSVSRPTLGAKMLYDGRRKWRKRFDSLPRINHAPQMSYSSLKSAYSC
ncbi:uncharacterized protein N7484_005293 [Penicillium longicatenatum]|uniref:uncharacterized protein n=1 Tax=Penicillium longicatenatum TaxID=1561947 RepID=UPI002546ACD0|nr:uncharacterized protein N7484_005293 [Penicillium longicatenatum]KAJ5651570.1 hypothetical protein N7484_005293 [Penicillium longicatenatum]